MTCGQPLNNDNLEKLAKQEIQLEGINTRSAEGSDAVAAFHNQLAHMSPLEQQAIYQRIKEIKSCSGATPAEQRTLMQPDGRKRVITDR